MSKPTATLPAFPTPPIGAPYWRTGVILASKDDNKAYVKADLEDAKIFVRISGNPPTRRSFLAIIRDIFDTIHEIPKLKPAILEMMIPRSTSKHYHQ